MFRDAGVVGAGKGSSEVFTCLQMHAVLLTTGAYACTCHCACAYILFVYTYKYTYIYICVRRSCNRSSRRISQCFWRAFLRKAEALPGKANSAHHHESNDTCAGLVPYAFLSIHLSDRLSIYASISRPIYACLSQFFVPLSI